MNSESTMRSKIYECLLLFKGDRESIGDNEHFGRKFHFTEIPWNGRKCCICIWSKRSVPNAWRNHCKKALHQDERCLVQSAVKLFKHLQYLCSFSGSIDNFYHFMLVISNIKRRSWFDKYLFHKTALSICFCHELSQVV